MARRLTEPDPQRVLAELTDAERDVFEGSADILGLGAGGWWAVASMRQHALLLAATRRAAALHAQEPGLAEGEGLRRAAEWLGLEDDSELGTHPGDSLARQLRRWREASRGQDVRAPVRKAI